MDTKLMKLLGWTMLGTGFGLMSMANQAAIESRWSRENAEKSNGLTSG